MTPEIEESPELVEVEAEPKGPSALTIGAFALGVVAGATLVVGLWALGGVATDRLDLGKPRPRKLLIGNLEIEERGDDTRFRVD